MSPITPADANEARSLFTKLEHLPASAADLKRAVAGNPVAERQVDVFLALRSKVDGPSAIDARVLSSALKEAGVSIEQMRGKMGSCPVGGASRKPELPPG